MEITSGRARNERPSSPTSAFHPSLENQDGSHSIHRLASFFDGKLSRAQQAVGLGGGKALVPEMDRKAEALAQILGESPDFLRLDTRGTAHAQGQADDDFLNVVVANDAIKLSEVVALILALEGFEALGGDAERIRDG